MYHKFQKIKIAIINLEYLLINGLLIIFFNAVCWAKDRTIKTKKKKYTTIFHLSHAGHM
jgi:hypothetical protein